MSRLLISAAHKSSGKTTVSIGLCAALRARGTQVQPFKKGPDYIDPMWLSVASGRPCRNLDFFIMGQDEIVAEFQRHSAGADLSLIEGNKGLYDGLNLDGSNSNAALARLLQAPVVLVIDARGMTRGIAPLILGYQAFDRSINIAGVILNNLGGARHESKLRAVIEHYTDVPVIGAVHHDKRLEIVERHLGLMPSNETEAATRRVNEIGALVGAQVDLDRLLEIGASASTLPEPLEGRPLLNPLPAPARSVPAGFPLLRSDHGETGEEANVSPCDAKASVRIGWAKDKAFGFYYADDLDALRAAGAELVPLDTLNDAHLPDVDGLFIGGGFPELFMRELEANASLREEIGRAIENGMPAYAECGGLMYLARTLTWHGEKHNMVGVIPGDVVMHEKPVGRGYVRLSETGESPWPAAIGQAPVPEEVRGHEFHYSSLDNLDTSELKYAYKVKRGHGIDGHYDGIVYKNLLASYAHMRSLETYNWAARFVAFVRDKAQGTGKPAGDGTQQHDRSA